MDIPKHIAIIMDGNGRWARKRNLPRLSGHREGVKRVEEIIRSANALGVAVLTLYAFSTENWARPATEIKGLFGLLKIFLRKKIKEFKKNNLRLRVIGDVTELPEDVVKEINSAVDITAGNTGMILNVALNYGGRQEIVNAVNKIIGTGIKDVKEETFKKYIYTAGLPDPELIIRTSGENRISNFLLWQSAYSEFYTTDILWPDFKKHDFLNAISEYQKRVKRFGGL
ncbi:MAG: isoprenyl transferase [Elusimicrobia bacterium]|nr:isoprenyl transferase [Elusimicrobiota bacterium]